MILSVLASLCSISCFFAPTDAFAHTQAPVTFNHSWDTLPVFWFSANFTAIEGPEQQALIAKYAIAILAWQTDVAGDPAWRHEESKIAEQAAQLAVSAPHTAILPYVQGQLVETWYDTQYKLMPPPCGNDTSGAYSDYFLMDNHTGTNRPAQWPAPNKETCPWMYNYDHGQPKVRDYFVNEVVLPIASIPNMDGIWFDSSDFLPCTGMGPYNMKGFGNMTINPRDTAAKQRLFNGTVAWKKQVATELNARGQIPIYSSMNFFNRTGCPYNEHAVADALAGLNHGRFYEGFGGSCTEILNAQMEAEAGIVVLVHAAGKNITTYDVAAFLVGAGEQSYFSYSYGWTDPGTKWEPAFYDQPLGKPLGPADVQGTKWTRQFEHTTVTLDCADPSAGIATISNWPSI